MSESLIPFRLKLQLSQKDKSELTKSEQSSSLTLIMISTLFLTLFLSMMSSINLIYSLKEDVVNQSEKLKMELNYPTPKITLPVASKLLLILKFGTSAHLILMK